MELLVLPIVPAVLGTIWLCANRCLIELLMLDTKIWNHLTVYKQITSHLRI